MVSIKSYVFIFLNITILVNSISVNNVNKLDTISNKDDSKQVKTSDYVDDDIDDDYNNDDATSSSFSSSDLSDADLDELSPIENNCKRTFINNNNNNKSIIVCSKIPLFCRNVCDIMKRLDFDSNLKRISSFSFGSYQIKQSMELNFKSGLEKIEADAFNGVVIESDIQLKINIDYDKEKNGFSDEDDDSDDNIDPKKEDDDSLLQNLQIDYDVDVDTTKANIINNDDNKVVKASLILPTRPKKSSQLFIQPNAFRGITIKDGGRFIIKISNSKKIEFGSKSLNGLKQQSSSSFLISIENSNLVLFKSKCADSWKAYTSDEDYDVSSNTNEDNSYDDAKTDFNSVNFDKTKDSSSSVLSKFNITNVKQVVFEKESFSNLKLFKSSTFQILIKNFDIVKLANSSFSRIEQAASSSFDINLSNGKQLTISEQAFSHLVQAEKSKFVFFANIIDSSVCLKPNTFSDLIQAKDSALRVTFLLNESNDLIINKNFIANSVQDANSIIQIYALKPNNIVLDTGAVYNLNQSKASTFEIWISKAASNFTIKSRAFKKVAQNSESSIRIGYSSSSEGYFKQAAITFDEFVSNPTAEVVYDFSKGTNFNMKFPGRPIPRFLPIAENNDGAKKRPSIEEMAWKLFPNLGRSARPDRINLQEYNLGSSDFCKIVDIPFDVLVNLNQNTECSCSVYYLYRVVRHMDEPNGIKDWILNAPECYRNKFLNTNDPESDLDKLEQLCKFNELVANCKRSPTYQLNDDSLQMDQLLDQCEDSFDYFITDNKIINPVVISNINDNYNNQQLTNDENTINNEENNVDSSEEKNDEVVVVKNTIEDEKPARNENKYVNNEEVDDGEDEDDDFEDDDDYNEEDDDGSDEVKIYKDDSNENNRIAESKTSTRKPDRASSFFSKIKRAFGSFSKKLFQNTALLGFFITGVASLVLVLIIVLIIFILKCKQNRSDKFAIYEEEDDDDYDEDNQNYDSDSEIIKKDTNKSYTKVNLTSVIANKLAKENENGFEYSKLENANENSNKQIYVKCNRANSIDSSIINISNENIKNHQAESDGSNLISIKTNPLSLV